MIDLDENATSADRTVVLNAKQVSRVKLRRNIFQRQNSVTGASVK